VLKKSFVSLSLVFPISVFAAESVITLMNGDTITADVIKQDEKNTYLSHPVLGEITLPNTSITTMTDVATTAVTEQVVADVEIATEETVEEPKARGLFGTSFLAEWQKAFSLGIAGSEGKSSSHQINLAFTADYEDEFSRLSHKSVYFRSESEGTLSDHSFYSVLNKDWLSPDSAWLKFANGRVDLDELKDWDYRINAVGGLGYEFIDTEEFLLLGKVGLGFSQTFGGEREEFTPEGSLGLETAWRLSEFQTLKAANTYYPSLDDFSEFRNITTVDWSLNMNTFEDMALIVGLSNEYDSQAEDDVDNNDFKYTISLSWSL
jgi:putative salt-induced outer membrane protein YdiY